MDGVTVTGISLEGREGVVGLGWCHKGISFGGQARGGDGKGGVKRVTRAGTITV